MPLVSRPFGDIITFTRASSATRFNAAGVLETVSSDTPRIDYDPVTLAPKGLLIEEQRTNLLTYSEQFDDGAWTKTRSAITANAAVSPDGTSDADKIIPDTSDSTTHIVSSSVSVTSGQRYTISVFAKAGEYGFLRLGLSGFFTTVQSAIFSLSDGSISITTGTITTTSQNIGNGWWRFSITSTATSSGNTSIQVGPSALSTTANYTGDGTSGIYIWGAQLEAGDFATSYIPTTTAAATRAADLASVNTLSPWYNQDEGTLFVEFLRQSAPAGTHIVAQIQSTGTNRHALFFTTVGPGNLRGITAVNNVTQADIFTGVLISTTSPSKVAYAYQVNNFAAAANGTLGIADTSGTVPSQLNQMWIGQNSVGNYLSGHIRRITYYPRRLSDAELQEITA